MASTFVDYLPDGKIRLDRASSSPLVNQLYEQLQRLIVCGDIPAGTRLPSSRALASMLEVSRNTVKSVFEDLLAEGYVECQVGSGTFVSQQLASLNLDTPHRPTQPDKDVPHSLLSNRSQWLLNRTVHYPPTSDRRNAFRNGMPDMTMFPHKEWQQIISKVHRNSQSSLFQEFASNGYRPLRVAVSDYLRSSRGVKCAPDQILITNSTQQSIYLACQVLLDEGQMVWLEDPHYKGALHAFEASGVTVHPVEVDQNGMKIDLATRDCPDAQLAFVTPSHQFPMGSTLSLKRRLELIQWAENRRTWIVEDDYDSEFRYSGRPIASLQGLDNGLRTIYQGTFSKVMFPGIRIAYMVVPDELVDSFTAALSIFGSSASSVTQAVLARFIDDGGFVRHLSRMRKCYARRHQALLTACRSTIGERLTFPTDGAGMHVCGHLAPQLEDESVQALARQRGIEALPLSRFSQRSGALNGLLLGFTAVREEHMQECVDELARSIELAETQMV